MKYIRRSDERGLANFGWLQSRHSFSFGRYYDPKHMGVSVLRVINDDTVQPSQGFGQHGHRDMEIISYVTEGALKHKDSSGNVHVVPAGDIQRMSAGRGVLHSEFNASDSERVKFFQIWIEPNVTGGEPGYAQKHIVQQGALTTLVSGRGEDGALSMQQDASLSRLVLAEGERFTLETAQRVGYLHLIKGQFSTDDNRFSAGDGFAVEPETQLSLTATEDVEALWFDLPNQSL
jgi:redox-sensitive bicupin YhaK (pirin superfamily)